ncbi:hypothetical protein BCR34DRAFT_228471 [Clohesyomyces aquaticus]|uniref:C2H2-type domain-containing protein n=1 Tax=Clohesyomyces aquaticus TaxID=1231657 RepID=A0A1Y1ZWH0_9PLEO|nr:hypothetical protein BCR34DRAFT_228471 [Clohesyomyces aquaticus]
MRPFGRYQPREIAQGSNHRSLDGDEPAVTATSGVPQRFSDDIQPGPSVIMTSRERETHKCDIADPESLLCRLELSLKRSVIHQLLEHALCEGAETFEGSDASGEHGGNSHSSEGRSRSAASTSGAGRLLGQKRQRRTRGQEDTDEEGAGEDGDDGDERRKKRGGPNFAKGPKILRRLKCPFYKRDPNKHSRAACRGEGFADMAKVKDHLKRVHSQPLRCPRCWEEMESEDLRVQHLQQDESCNKRPEPIDDRISLQQWRRLDFKKAPYAYARTAEEKWKILYRTLFPDDVDIPSPYEDHGISLQYERLLAVSLQEELEREFEPILEPILSRIRDKIPSIIRRCKIRLLEESDKDVIYTPSGSSNRSNSHGSNESQDSGRQSAARLPNTTSEPSYNPLLSEAADASSFDLSTDIPPNASAPPWSSPSPWDLLYSNFDFQSYMKDFGQ